MRTLMTCLVLAVLLCSCAAPWRPGPAQTGAAQPAPTRPSPTTPPRAVIIDTDMAADDWMAILYLLNRPDIAVEAITVSGTGEAHCGPGIRNVYGLLALAHYQAIPVACGRTTPLEGHHAFPDDWRIAVDNLFGMTLPKGQISGSALDAMTILTSTIQESRTKVTLLALGPLTNLGETLEKTPSLVDRIEMVYVMGGAVDVPGNIASSGSGIANDVAEWNIYVDPHAASLVFASGAPITLVPLDATNFVKVTPAFYARLARNHNSAEAAFIYDLYSQNRSFYESGTLYFWDPSAAAILTDQSIAAFKSRALCVVEREGRKSGQLVTQSGCSNIRFAYSINRPEFEILFLNTLNGRAE
jgi:inosine-uridine nucleoside N-ribohydrolase